MKQLPNSNNVATPEELQERKEERLLDRRRLLKALTVSSGVVIASSLLPNEWVKPVVEVGYLPVHAQTSPVGFVRFRIELANPTTGQIVSLTQDGTTGTLILRPGTAPPPTCTDGGSFVGNGYTVTVDGDRPAGNLNITVIGTAETPVPGGCQGVEMKTNVECTATADPVNLVIPVGTNSVTYVESVPNAYRAVPCFAGCENTQDGLAGTITISDDAGTIPTLTITVMMQGSCI
jgi:hypothetical protein